MVSNEGDRERGRGRDGGHEVEMLARHSSREIKEREATRMEVLFTDDAAGKRGQRKRLFGVSKKRQIYII